MIKKKQGTYSEGDCAIAAVQVNSFNPDNMVNIIQQHNNIYENSKEFRKIVKLTDYIRTYSAAVYFKLEHYTHDSDYIDDFLIASEVNDFNEPLFYAYELKFDVEALTELDTLQLYLNNSVLIPKENYVIQYAYTTLDDNYNGADDPDLRRYGTKVEWGEFDPTKTIHRVRLLFPSVITDKNTFYIARYNKRVFGVTTNNYSELVEYEHMFRQGTDYDIVDYSGKSGKYVQIDDDSRISYDTVNTIYIVKDPFRQVKVNNVLSFPTEGFQDVSETSWNISVNTGSFSTREDTHVELFHLEEPGSTVDTRHQIISHIRPNIIGRNIIKVKEGNIWVDTDKYVYPNYEITLFDRFPESNNIPIGSIGINVNNNINSKRKILSIDRKRGFILINQSIDIDDDIELFYYIDIDKQMYIRNMEFNPRLDGTEYGTGNIASPNQIINTGIAIRKKSGTNVNDLQYRVPYFFDETEVATDGTRTFYQGKIISNSLPTTSRTGKLIFDYYTGVNEPDAEYIQIASISINKLYPDILNVYDARVPGGGLGIDLRDEMNADQRNSYVDHGYYNGEPIPSHGVVIIHIPRKTYDDLVDRWLNSDLFNKYYYTDISIEELEEFAKSNEEYNKLLQGVSTTNQSINETYTSMKKRWADKEASTYIDQIIRKYISSGTQYILLDEEYKEINLKLD